MLPWVTKLLVWVKLKTLTSSRNNRFWGNSHLPENLKAGSLILSKIWNLTFCVGFFDCVENISSVAQSGRTCYHVLRLKFSVIDKWQHLPHSFWCILNRHLSKFEHLFVSNLAVALSFLDLNIHSSLHPASTSAFITLFFPLSLLTSFFIWCYLSKSSSLSSIILIRFCVIVLIIIHMSIIDLFLFQTRIFNCLHPLLVLNEYTHSAFTAH